MSVHRSERLKGARFGPYEIVALIGHGATASVFEATHTALGKHVAIKLLHEHLSADTDLAARFLREGRVAARLRHPNAIDVLDVGVEDGAPYLVTELLHGTDLRSVLSEGPLAPETALAYLLPIASALQRAHDAGVLHRDLKPANIFLARDVRDDVVPKLLDFGLSKAEGDAAALTRSELVAGTVLYMAPEQTLGVRHASPASDQYSLAVILYESLVGRPPFAADGSVYDVIAHIRSGVITPPSVASPAVPPALDAVLLRALHRDPKARYESVRALARDLLPFASEATRAGIGRDFLDRANAADAPASKPSSRRISGVERVERVAESAETQAEISGSSSALRAIAPLPCPPGTSPFHIKGVFYKGFLQQVAAVVGLEPFCEALPDEPLRAFVRQPFLATARYDVLPFVPLWQALARKLGVRHEALVRTSTAAQARYDAKHVYKTIFDTQRPEDFADRVSRFNSNIYDFGKFGGKIPRPNRMIIEFSRIPAYLEVWFGPMHVAYTEESLRIGGAKDVTVVSHAVEDAGANGRFPLVSFRTELSWR